MYQTYFSDAFKLLHDYVNDPAKIYNIYNKFMWDYHLKHRESFNFTGTFEVYNKAQAETFYRYVRRYKNNFIEDKL